MAKSSEENGLSAPGGGGSLSGTRETLSDLERGSLAGDELSSLGSDSEVNGYTGDRKIDRYGFIVESVSAESPPTEIPLEVLRQREAKWLDMLNNWDKWMAKRHKKIRLRCQKGIPPSLRGRAWQYLSGSKVRLDQNLGKFDELDSMAGDPKWVDIIERDLHRQFPFHEMFVSRGGHGQQDLYRVLKAYTLYRPEEGYCQAQAPIAAVLLMHMPAEEAIQLDGRILFSLLRRVSPLAYKHLSKQKIDPILYMTEWFMCAFSRTLPWSSVLRVWDMFLCEGVKIIFRVGLVLLKYTLGSSEKLKSCQGQYETMEKLKAIDTKYMQENFLVQEIIELPISERDIEREHLVQLKKWKEEYGEIACKSPSRMHGAKAISDAEPHSQKASEQSQKTLQYSPSIILPPNTNIPATGKKTKEQKQAEKQLMKEQREKEKEQREKEKLEKKQSKGKKNAATSPTDKNGAQLHEKQTLTKDMGEPSAKVPSQGWSLKQQHQSNESLCSRESEDTYL
uniref:TBC1 domain family member 10A isoform X2 n=1 Tax=Geotrypetes seraphini TaxID=260995 RepID=A0A6P8RZT4_GEOSA|nr:TBC1 domain family member 10A isoform X2 [Geotrypetes seraphini]